jgi:endoglucanase
MNKFNFRTSANWLSGFTGKLELTNEGKTLDGWTLEFEAPFDIIEIWDAEIISHEGNKYVIGNLDYNKNLSGGETKTITFNANKIGGEVVAPDNYFLNEAVAATMPISETVTTNAANVNSDEAVGLIFRTSANWLSGFTGKLDITNEGESLDGWQIEFEAPFEITKIWDAEIISHEGNKYVIGNLDYNKNLSGGETKTITFNANKIEGEVVAPANYSLKVEQLEGQALATESSSELSDPLKSVSLAAESTVLAESTARETRGSGQFNYGEALQKSFLYYEANRSGDLPTDNRIKWRGDSALNDGADVGRDLSGGYYDAGDHVKFGLPMAAANTMLAWGGVEYKQAYQKSGQWDEFLDAVKWGTDYFLKTHVTEGSKTKELYVQVGDGNLDHAYWGSPEKMTMNRPSFKVDANNPGSDVAAGTASALASASMLFRGVDNAYADLLLENARQLFEFADTYLHKYSDSVPQANPFYTSNGYADELAESAAWLYKATGEQQYLDRAEQIYDREIGNPGNWSWVADDKSYSTLLMLAQESNDPKYQQKFENWASKWVNGTEGVQYTSGGLAWRTGWGSLALSAASSFLLGVYNDTVKSKASYQDFSIGQVDYILGDNPRNFSYMVGFGDNYPQQPHHRAASGTAPYGQPNEHILHGAMVAGPNSADDYDYSDDRKDYFSNEVAMSWNAPLTSALIQSYETHQSCSC